MLEIYILEYLKNISDSIDVESNHEYFDAGLYKWTTKAREICGNGCIQEQY